MKKYKISDNLVFIAKDIKKDFINDKIVQYFCNSIIKTKDELNKMMTMGFLHAHILEKYKFEIWKK